MIQRKDRETGLLYEEMVEKKIIDNRIHFIASQKGINHILYLIGEKEREEEQKKVKAEKQDIAITQINLFKSFIDDFYLPELYENASKGKGKKAG